MVKRRRTYTREFKLEAIRLAEVSDRPLTEIARELGIHPNLLYKWRDQFVKDGALAFPGQGQVAADEGEVQRLRRELAQVKEE